MEANAQWIANMMKADGVTIAQVAAMPEDDRITLVFAYLDAMNRKIENMQTQLLTNPRKMEAFTKLIRSLV